MTPITLTQDEVVSIINQIGNAPAAIVLGPINFLAAKLQAARQADAVPAQTAAPAAPAPNHVASRARK